MASDSVFDRWRERWLRRGELLAVAAFTSAIATAASGRYVPLGVAIFVLLVGVYIISAAEAGWWLPGHRRALDRASADAMNEFMRNMLPNGGGTSADGTAVVRELRRLVRTLERIAPPVDKTRTRPQRDDETTS